MTQSKPPTALTSGNCVGQAKACRTLVGADILGVQEVAGGDQEGAGAAGQVEYA